MTLTDLILEMKQLQEDLDTIKEAEKKVRDRYDKLRLFEIPDAMAEGGDLRSITGEFGRVTLTTDLGVKVLVDKSQLHQYLTETGNAALIVPTVNAQTLKAFVKEQMVNGTPVPDTIVEARPFSRAVLYKN